MAEVFVTCEGDIIRIGMRLPDCTAWQFVVLDGGIELMVLLHEAVDDAIERYYEEQARVELGVLYDEIVEAIDEVVLTGKQATFDGIWMTLYRTGFGNEICFGGSKRLHSVAVIETDDEVVIVTSRREFVEWGLRYHREMWE